MTEYCLFRLYGPMATWGDIAVGEERRTSDHPSKSAILGLVAAALGIRRSEEEVHSSLSSGYSFAVLVNAPGVPVQDFHTIHAPPRSDIKRGKYFLTRKDELGIGAVRLSTIISRRDYLCDMVTTICLWQRAADVPFSMNDIKNALISPAFVPYLGRKSCPVSMPLQAQVIEADSVMGAFNQAAFPAGDFFTGVKFPSEAGVYWDADAKADLDATHVQVCRDEIVSRKRWLFRNRRENFAMVKSPKGSDL